MEANENLSVPETAREVPATETQPELSPMAKQLDSHRDALSDDLRANLTDGSDQVYLAAYTSAIENGMDEEAAKRVAWNTIEHDFVKSADGKWQRRPDEPGIHNKSVTSGGN